MKAINTKIYHVFLTIAIAAIFALTIISSKIGTPFQLSQAGATLPIHIVAAIVLSYCAYEVNMWTEHFENDKK